MRIQFYGIQGSGSIFPRKAERRATRRVADHELIEAVLKDISERFGQNGKLDCSIEDIVGGALDWKRIQNYCDRLALPPQPIYGGWTTCVHVETNDGIDMVFDCGSGFRNCAKDLQDKWGDTGERDLYLFGSHSHRDHTEGFDQAAVCFDPRNRIRIVGNNQFLCSLNDYLGIFSRSVRKEMLGVQSPIYFVKMPASFDALRIHSADDDLDKGANWATPHAVETPIEISDNVRVTPFELCHPAPCLGYRVEADGKVFVFSTDHELRRPREGETDTDSEALKRSMDAESRLRGYCQDIDVLYRDGQFLRVEYDGDKGVGGSGAIPRLGWGHSCIEDVSEMAAECGVKQTYIGHHDPNREWSELNWINESLMRNGEAHGRKIQLARAETVVEL